MGKALPPPPPPRGAPLTPNTALLQARHCAEMLGVSPSYFKVIARDPAFPRPVKLLGDGNVRRWRREDVEEWVRSLPTFEDSGQLVGERAR